MDGVVCVGAYVGDGGDGGDGSDGGGDGCSGRNGGGAVAKIRAGRQPSSGQSGSRIQGEAVSAFRARQ
jgi:hypothetical protein